LNIGGGSKTYGDHVINLELEPAPGVDVVGRAEALPFRTEAFAGIILQAVLEHLEDADAALSEIHRVLAPGGALLVEVPFIQGYHPGPLDRRRFTEEGLRAELERHGFAVEASGVAVGPASAMAWVSAEFLALLLSGRSSRAYRVVRIGTRWLAWPVKWLDSWLSGHPMAHVVASGVWARARRK